MNSASAVRFINVYLVKNGYSDLFEPSPDTILRENRRMSRPANVQKYGKIPFTRKGNKADYKIEDIQELCNDKIKTICAELEKMRMAKAEKALKGARLPYAD